jgi:hypothetical protein
VIPKKHLPILIEVNGREEEIRKKGTLFQQRIMILVAQNEALKEKLVGIFYLLARLLSTCFLFRTSTFQFLYIKEMDVTNKQKKLKTKEGEAQLVIDNETSRHRLALVMTLHDL